MNDQPDRPPAPQDPVAPSIFLSERAEPPTLPQVSHPPGRRLALILFLATCLSTIIAGTNDFPAFKPLIDPATGKVVIDPSTGRELVESEIDPVTGRRAPRIDWRQRLLYGLIYATAVMAMLGAHEMGHYLQARRYGVPASLPMF